MGLFSMCIWSFHELVFPVMLTGSAIYCQVTHGPGDLDVEKRHLACGKGNYLNGVNCIQCKKPISSNEKANDLFCAVVCSHKGKPKLDALDAKESGCGYCMHLKCLPLEHDSEEGLEVYKRLMQLQENREKEWNRSEAKKHKKKPADKEGKKDSASTRKRLNGDSGALGQGKQKKPRRKKGEFFVISGWQNGGMNIWQTQADSGPVCY